MRLGRTGEVIETVMLSEDNEEIIEFDGGYNSMIETPKRKKKLSISAFHDTSFQIKKSFMSSEPRENVRASLAND